MKPYLLIGIGALALGLPTAYGQNELEELQALCKEQERQILLLQQEIKALKQSTSQKPGEKSTPEPTPTLEPTSEPAPAAVVARTHKIVAGDNFEKIARKYGVTTAAIVAANPKAKAKSLQIGQEIIIPDGGSAKPEVKKASTKKPSATEPASAPEKPAAAKGKKIRTLTLEEETTFADFAAKHGTTTTRLNELNGWDLADETLLAIGSELYVPGQP